MHASPKSSDGRTDDEGSTVPSCRSTRRVLHRLLFASLSITSANACAPTASYEVVIRGGTVYDGTGSPGVIADVALVGDSIAAIGDLGSSRGAREIDARGMAVAPGFINMNSSAYESLLYDGRSQSDLRQGVTLEVLGEGDSWGPVNDRVKQWLLRQQGDIKYPIEWTTLDGALTHLTDRGISTNVASFLGAVTVRKYFLGSDDRAPTPAQLDSMRALVRQAMEEGALGIGASLIYAPDTYATTAELIELSKVAAAYRGRYIAHMRSEGNHIYEALDEMLAIARAASIPVEIYHLKAAGVGNHAKMDTVIARIDAARRSGVSITANIYPYTQAATGLDASMPPWVQEGGIDEWRRRLRDPGNRERVRREMTNPMMNWENFYLASGSADSIWLRVLTQDSLKYLTGRSLQAVARLFRESPEEAAMDLVIRDGSRVGTRYALMSEDNVRKELALPWVSFGSDEASESPEGLFLKAKPHPRAYGTFARVLGHYVREERLQSLADAIRRMTSLPAANLGIERRGALKRGNFADVVIFDPATITEHATYEQPQRFATGVVHVFVNGQQVIRDGQHTGLKPGRVVRGPGYRRRP